MCDQSTMVDFCPFLVLFYKKRAITKGLEKFPPFWAIFAQKMSQKSLKKWKFSGRGPEAAKATSWPSLGRLKLALVHAWGVRKNGSMSLRWDFRGLLGALAWAKSFLKGFFPFWRVFKALFRRPLKIGSQPHPIWKKRIFFQIGWGWRP